MKALCFFFLLLAGVWIPCYGQKTCSAEEVHKVVSVFKKEHYAPRAIDNVFSEKLFYKFIHSVDQKHLLLLRPEVLAWSEYKHSLDDELNNHQLKFVAQVAPVYRQSLQRAQKILEALKTKGFRAAPNDQYIPHHLDSLDYALTETELATRWEKYLKLETYLKDFQNRQDSIAGKPSLPDLYQQVINRTLARINRETQENKKSLKHLYYEYARCIPALFDAHSSYMSYHDYQNFESMLSGENYKFGITIDKNKLGAIEVVRITPGSPAWKSGKINIGDVITHLRWQNGAKVELDGLELQEVSELLDYSNNLFLEFTLRPATGAVQVLSLKKEKTTSSENLVKGYILAGKDGKKIGYICLPSFYTLFESETMLGCANDVARELVKLRQENIEGLVFDLRNNGGGSLKEGLELSGLFINEGTLALYKKKGQPAGSMKDLYRGTAYSGPMVVMVNGHSASASELMASTLQDFNRAVVVGSDTYGKATGQELIPLNPLETRVPDSLRSGFVSVTLLKLYRVTGKSNQRSGLQPDIVLPDPFVNLYENESKEPEAMEKDTVLKKTYYQPLSPLPLEKLRTLSAGRISLNAGFAKVEKLAKKYSRVFEISDVTVLLNQEAIRKLCQDYIAWQEDVKKYYYAETSVYTVQPTLADGTLNQLSEEDRLLSEYSIRKIRTDLALEESFLIVNDLINTK